jgi:FkbM family methyltransferase
MMVTRRKVAVGQSPSAGSVRTTMGKVSTIDKESSSSTIDDMSKQERRNNYQFLLQESVILKFAHRMAILYWLYQVLIATYLGSKRTFKLSTVLGHHDYINFELNGGFCPPTHCPIIGTSTLSIRNVPTKKSTTISAYNNSTNKLITTNVNDTLSFQMFIRDPKSDTFISGLLSTGQKHDPKIQNLIIRVLSSSSTTTNNEPLFIDIGANIGYFTATALALGAHTISFEPYHYNAMTLLSTINVNPGWGTRSSLYMNTLGYEANRVTMKSTNDKINKSNMHITGNTCRLKQQHNQRTHSNNDGEYGIDYMDEVSLDQVLLLNHHNHHAVTLMKIDVETYEIHVLNGAMYSLCNIVIGRIVLEVEYLKPSYNLSNKCNFDTMRQTLLHLGYELFDVEEKTVYTDNVDLQQLPSDILFRLNDFSQSPATRLRGTVDNPCAKFDLHIQ